MKEKVICDTNVISRYLLGKYPEITAIIEEIGIENIYYKSERFPTYRRFFVLKLNYISDNEPK